MDYWENGQCFCNIDEGGRHYGVALGERNSQYRVSPKERMSPEVYKRWLESRSKSMQGNKNHQYGISPHERMDEETYEQWRVKQRQRKLGKTNPKAKPMIMFNDDGFYMEFDTTIDCARYIKENKISNNSKLIGIQSNLSTAINKKRKYLGYNYKFKNINK